MCCAVIMRYLKKNLVEKLTYTRTEYFQTYTFHGKSVKNFFRNIDKKGCDKITVACLQTKAPKGQFRVSIFWLSSCYICHIIPCTVNLSPCHAPVWPMVSALDAWDKVQTHINFVSEACN